MPSEDQSAASSISLVIIPAPAASEQAAPHTECCADIYFIVSLSQLVIEEEVTGSCFPIQERNR